MRLVTTFTSLSLGMSSKKDENILFCSEEERHAYEARLNHADKEDYFENRDSSFEKNAAGESERQYHYSSSATPFAESQNINRPCRRVPVLPPRTVRKKRNNFAEQQRQCAILSRSHKFVRPERDKKRRKRRLSDTEVKSTRFTYLLVWLICPCEVCVFNAYTYRKEENEKKTICIIDFLILVLTELPHTDDVGEI